MDHLQSKNKDGAREWNILNDMVELDNVWSTAENDSTSTPSKTLTESYYLSQETELKNQTAVFEQDNEFKFSDDDLPF